MKLHSLIGSAVSVLLLACSGADPVGSGTSELGATLSTPCTPAECGAEPEIAIECGGKTLDPVCEREHGVCGWVIPHCPTTVLKPPPVLTACPVGEKSCVLENTNGTCSNRCVADTVLCGEPTCRVCDPPPPPEPGCAWDLEACEWICL
jgi:hypothetical protein